MYQFNFKFKQLDVEDRREEDKERLEERKKHALKLHQNSFMVRGGQRYSLPLPSILRDDESVGNDEFMNENAGYEMYEACDEFDPEDLTDEEKISEEEDENEETTLESDNDEQTNYWY